MRIAVLACLMLAACEDEYVPVVVPVARVGGAIVSTSERDDAIVASIDPCDMHEPNIERCTPIATVRAGAVLGDGRCFYDTKVQKDDVGRILSCPNHRALVVFDRARDAGGARFVGTYSRGALNVCATSTYDFPQGDGCTWHTEQRITGSLACGFGYSYSESPVAGKSCTLACSARGKLAALDE